MNAQQKASAAQVAARALESLEARQPALAEALSGLLVVVVDEAARSRRFATALLGALGPGAVEAPTRRTGRRAPAVVDPLEVYAESAEDGLRERLAQLDLEQLKDVVAQYGMDHDRLAMRWRDPQRVVDRIVEKVIMRTEKGSAFRE